MGIGRGRRRGPLAVSPGRSRALLAAVALGLAAACTTSASRVSRPQSSHVAFAPTSGSRPVLFVPAAHWLDADLRDRMPVQPTLLVDLAGRGRSPRPRDREATLAADLEELDALRARVGVERVVLLGWSYYGGLAVRYALEYPERVAGLVLVSPLPPRREPFWTLFLGALARRARPETQAELRRVASAPESDPALLCRTATRAFFEVYAADPAILDTMLAEPCRSPNLDPAQTAQMGRRIIEELGDWDWTADLASLRAPVLIVHGAEDPLPRASSELYAQYLPDAQLVVAEGAGHLAWLEAPSTFYSALERFLDRVAALEAESAASAERLRDR